MIIDCHVHLNNYHDEGVDALGENLGKLQRAMRRNRIDAAVVLTSYKLVPGRPSTRAVIEAVAAAPNIYVVAGVPFGTLSEETLDELRMLLTEGSIRGLKLYPGYEPFYPHDPALHPVYRLAAEFKVPVMIHCGDTYSPKGKVKYSHPLHVDDVAVDHPDVDFIICHLGNPWFRDCMQVVYKNENVYADISGLVLGDFTDRFERFMRNELQEMLLWGVDPSHVLFGTDWPISTMESYLEFIEDIKIPVTDRRLIMYENAARLFRIPVVEDPTSLSALLRRR
jgi:uncharacterized protein